MQSKCYKTSKFAAYECLVQETGKAKDFDALIVGLISDPFSIELHFSFLPEFCRAEAEKTFDFCCLGSFAAMLCA